MADNIELNSGSGGATIATDDDGTAHHQYVKLEFGADDTRTKVTAAAGLPITNDSAGDLVVSLDGETVVLGAGTAAFGKLAANDGVDIGDVTLNNGFAAVVGGGAEATALRVTIANDSTGVVSIDDGGGDISIDWAGTAPPIGAGLEATALRVTLATDSTGVVSVDDNGGALTVDNGGTFAVQVDAALPAGDNNIGNVDIVTVPAPLNVVGGGTEAAAMRVTIANDSTGVVTVDDGGSALTVDNAGTFAVQVDGDALTSLQVIDDWDESDRCKVNIIAGQAGIAAGAGAVGVTVPRFTLASDDPAVALLTTIDADTDAIKTAVETIDNAIAGTEMQVDVVASLPAGTNAIGKLAANSGVDIGDVDVTSISAGTNTIGGVIGMGSTSTAYDGTTAATIKRVSGLAASGTTAMIAAVAGYQIRVLAIALCATSSTVTNVYVANDDNDLLFNAANPLPLQLDPTGNAVGGYTLQFNQGGWFQTDTDNEALNLVLSAAQDVQYCVTYIEVT